MARKTHPTLSPTSTFWWSIHRNIGRTPRWTFPDTLLGYGLRLERLNFDNYDDLWPVLATGDTDYVNREYREREALYEQVMMLHAYAPYTGTNGAVDYLVIDTPGKHGSYRSHDRWDMIKDIDLEEGETLAGVIHLYELSMERLGDMGMPNPLVGIQLAQAYRGAGIADRAFDLLEHFVAVTYPDAHHVTAMIERENLRSQRFFRRRGYEPTDEYGDDESNPKTVFLVKVLGTYP